MMLPTEWLDLPHMAITDCAYNGPLKSVIAEFYCTVVTSQYLQNREGVMTGRKIFKVFEVRLKNNSFVFLLQCENTIVFA